MFPSTRRALTLILLLLLMVSAPGCLFFETETMVFVFAKDVPEVHGLLVYEGIGVWGDKAPDLKRAKELFSQLATNEQWLCFGDWFLFYTMEPQGNDGPEEQRFKALLREHFVIRNGGLYYNKEGKLCGYQTFTIREAEKLFDELNKFLSPFIGAEAAQALADPKKRLLDEESLTMIKKAADTQFKWLELQPGRLRFTLPMTPRAVRNVKKKWLVSRLADLREDVTRLTAPPAGELDERKLDERRGDIRWSFENIILLAGYLAETPVSFEQHQKHIAISVGLGNGEPFQITMPQHGEKLNHHKELVALPEQLKVPFRDDLNTEKLIEAFLREKGKLKQP